MIFLINHFINYLFIYHESTSQLYICPIKFGFLIYLTFDKHFSIKNFIIKNLIKNYYY